MEHEERNEQIRQKMLGEIADIEAFARAREPEDLKADRMYQKAVQKDKGFILGGEKPWCYSHTQRVKRRAFTHLGIKGYTPYDFRTTFATRAKESGQTSAQVADLLGHKDTRMVERIYARTRHQSVMKQLEAIERLNS